MRIILLAVIAFCFIVPSLMAQGPQTVATLQFWGDIVDNYSVSTLRPDELADFMMTYTKEDALKPISRLSGYSIYTNGRLIKFTGASSSLIVDFLSRPLSTIHVFVTAKWSGDRLVIIMIKNQ
jgi:hypothetical protein